MLKDRITLDRRRLEDAHMIYAVLNVMVWYPEHFKVETNMQSHNSNISWVLFTEIYRYSHVSKTSIEYVTGSAKAGHNCTSLNLQYKALNTLGAYLYIVEKIL